MDNPCRYCENQGCGAYHDICPEHDKWKRKEEEKKSVIKKGKEFHGRGYIRDSTFTSRTHRAFKSRKKGI